MLAAGVITIVMSFSFYGAVRITIKTKERLSITDDLLTSMVFISDEDVNVR